jgi:hypothetical protein
MTSKDDVQNAKEKAKNRVKEIFRPAPADVEEELKRKNIRSIKKFGPP